MVRYARLDRQPWDNWGRLSDGNPLFSRLSLGLTPAPALALLTEYAYLTSCQVRGRERRPSSHPSHSQETSRLFGNYPSFSPKSGSHLNRNRSFVIFRISVKIEYIFEISREKTEKTRSKRILFVRNFVIRIDQRTIDCSGKILHWNDWYDYICIYSIDKRKLTKMNIRVS